MRETRYSVIIKSKASRVPKKEGIPEGLERGFLLIRIFLQELCKRFHVNAAGKRVPGSAAVIDFQKFLAYHSSFISEYSVRR